jgi:Uma2 family endonuclease
MSQEVYAPEEVIPDLEAIDIEGEKVVESVYPEKLYRLLAESLSTNWAGPGEGRTFQVFTGVGLFYQVGRPGLCPDLMLALDIEPGDPAIRANRSYFTWLRGKVPDLILEIVSDREGGEEDHKMREYQRLRVPNYVIYDPRNALGNGVLRSFDLPGQRYRRMDRHFYEIVGLGLTLWEGEYEGLHETWLRWCDANGQLIPTGAERVAAEAQRAQAEAQRAQAEAQRAQAEAQRADRERARVEALEARLRELGIEP